MTDYLRTLSESTSIELSMYGHMPFSIEVRGIENGGEIPVDLTCDGANYSPEIGIREAPTGTKSFALIVEDPDAPMGLFVHWVIYGMGSEVKTIREKIEKSERTREGYVQGKNDFGRVGYDGPCPPRGHGFHRYFFKLYALSSLISTEGSATRKGLLKAMEGKVLGETEIIGKYRR